ncbi:MAG: hypothetical protein ACKVQS_09250 [Fimbriimonadaceae bacterium]
MIELLCAAIAFGYMNQVTATEVSFQGVGLELKGTLRVPESKIPMPAVLLLPGSGPTDRDGNQPPTIVTNVLKEISAELNNIGIVTLCFDKRPVHTYKNQWPTDKALISKFFSVENHLSDIKSAYSFLAKQPSADKTKMFLLGHSEGAMFSNHLASELNPKGIVLLGAPGRGMDVIVIEQLARNFSALPDGELKSRLISDTDRAIKLLKEKAEEPKDIHPALAQLFNYSTVDIWHGYFNIDPIADAKLYKGQVFIGNGQSDIQISAMRDSKPLAAAYGDQATLFIVPNASHNLKHVDSDKEPGLSGPVEPGLIQSLKDWFKKQVG